MQLADTEITVVFYVYFKCTCVYDPFLVCKCESMDLCVILIVPPLFSFGCSTGPVTSPLLLLMISLRPPDNTAK